MNRTASPDLVGDVRHQRPPPVDRLVLGLEGAQHEVPGPDAVDRRAPGQRDDLVRDDAAVGAADGGGHVHAQGDLEVADRVRGVDRADHACPTSCRTVFRMFRIQPSMPAVCAWRISVMALASFQSPAAGGLTDRPVAEQAADVGELSALTGGLQVVDRVVVRIRILVVERDRIRGEVVREDQSSGGRSRRAGQMAAADPKRCSRPPSCTGRAAPPLRRRTPVVRQPFPGSRRWPASRPSGTRRP